MIMWNAWNGMHGFGLNDWSRLLSWDVDRDWERDWNDDRSRDVDMNGNGDEGSGGLCKVLYISSIPPCSAL